MSPLADRLKPLLRGLGFLALYGAAAWVGIHVRGTTGASANIWIPSGLGLAAVVLFGQRMLGWIFLGAFLAIASERALVVAALLALTNVLDAWLGAKLTRRFVSERPSLSTVREVLTFVALACVCTAASSSVKLLVMLAMGGLPLNALPAAWRSWWMSGSLGQVLVGGALLAWANGAYSRFRPSPRRRWELACLLFAVATIAVLNYTGLAHYYRLVFLRPFTLFPLMMWAALRFDLIGVTSVGLVVVMCWMFGALRGFMPATPLSPVEGAVLQQYFLFAWGTIGFVLAAAVREKQEAIDARNEFLSVASHELRTPVTSVMLQLQFCQKQLLAQSTRNKEEEKWLESFRRAGAQVGRLGRLVDQLLDVSRIDRRDLSLHYESVDLAPLIEEIVARMQGDLAAAHCAVELALARGVHGRWDPLRVEQVLENLVTNAIRYAPGASIRIATAERDGFVEIEFSDRGPGIEEAKLGMIFERFYRADRESKGVRGMGLGLFISREIVQAHQGSIAVDSAPGRGTRFSIRMPLDPDQVPRL